jgi:hypothetical protein
MRYLEKFNTSLWQELDRRQFTEEIENATFVDFIDVEIKGLEDMFSDLYGYYFAQTDSENPLFLSSNFKFNKRLNFLGQALYSKKVINGLIYISGGQGSAQRMFRIGKLDDEYYLVEVESTVYEGVKYYKCDQLDGFLELLKSFTFRLKKRDRDKEAKNADRNKKMNIVLSTIKSMSWEEFDKFYNQFTK